MDHAGFKDWLCRRIVAESRDAIIFADQDGRIRLWNAGAEAMFGYRAAEMEGQTLDLIIPEALRARHNEGFRRVMASGREPLRRRPPGRAGLKAGRGPHFPGVHHHPGQRRPGPGPGGRGHYARRHHPLAAGPGTQKAPGGVGRAGIGLVLREFWARRRQPRPSPHLTMYQSFPSVQGG